MIVLVFDEARQMFNTRGMMKKKQNLKRKYTSIELFAGAGGLALGLEKAGFEHVALNEIILMRVIPSQNRPQWNVLEVMWLIPLAI